MPKPCVIIHYLMNTFSYASLVLMTDYSLPGGVPLRVVTAAISGRVR